jgi:hypothetical protein
MEVVGIDDNLSERTPRAQAIGRSNKTSLGSDPASRP